MTEEVIELLTQLKTMLFLASNVKTQFFIHKNCVPNMRRYVNRQNQIVVKDVGQFLFRLIKKISISVLATYYTEEQIVINAKKKVKISMTSLHTY